MGNVCSTQPEQKAQLSREEKERQKKKSKLVEIDQKEIVLAKLMVQRDRFEAKITKQDEKEKYLKEEALQQARNNKREEAHYTLKKIKRVRTFRKNLRNKLEFIDKQVDNIENAMDDVSFTKTVAESNRVLEKLNEEIDMEEIVIAKELEQEGKMRREELDALLDDSDDEDLRDELNQIEAQILEGDLGKVDAGKVAGGQKASTEDVASGDKEIEAILA